MLWPKCTVDGCCPESRLVRHRPTKSLLRTSTRQAGRPTHLIYFVRHRFVHTLNASYYSASKAARRLLSVSGTPPKRRRTQATAVAESPNESYSTSEAHPRIWPQEVATQGPPQTGFHMENHFLGRRKFPDLLRLSAGRQVGQFSSSVRAAN